MSVCDANYETFDSRCVLVSFQDLIKTTNFKFKSVSQTIQQKNNCVYALMTSSEID